MSNRRIGWVGVKMDRTTMEEQMSGRMRMEVRRWVYLKRDMAGWQVGFAPVAPKCWTISRQYIGLATNIKLHTGDHDKRPGNDYHNAKELMGLKLSSNVVDCDCGKQVGMGGVYRTSVWASPYLSGFQSGYLLHVVANFSFFMIAGVVSLGGFQHNGNMLATLLVIKSARVFEKVRQAPRQHRHIGCGR